MSQNSIDKKYTPLSSIIFSPDYLEPGAMPIYYMNKKLNAHTLVRGDFATQLLQEECLIIPICITGNKYEWHGESPINKAYIDLHGKIAINKALDITTISVLDATANQYKEKNPEVNINPKENPKSILVEISDAISCMEENGFQPQYIIVSHRIFNYMALIEHKMLFIEKDSLSTDEIGNRIAGYFREFKIIKSPKVEPYTLYITAKPNETGVFVNANRGTNGEHVLLCKLENHKKFAEISFESGQGVFENNVVQKIKFSEK